VIPSLFLFVCVYGDDGLWMKVLERQVFKVALHLTKGSTPFHPLLIL